MTLLPDHLSKASVGTERISQEVLESHQRDKVIAAAIPVFAKRGYRNATIDHIVAAAKVGVGSFYNLFEGKEDCLLQAYDLVIEEAQAIFAEAIAAEGDWPAQTRSVLKALLELIEADPSRARLALAEAQTAGPAALERYHITIDGALPPLAQGRELCPWADALPDRLELAIAGGLAWFLQEKVAEGNFKGAKVHLPEVLEIVIEPYIGAKAVAAL